MGGGLTLTNWLNYGPIYCGAGSEARHNRAGRGGAGRGGAVRAAGQDGMWQRCLRRLVCRLRCGVYYGPGFGTIYGAGCGLRAAGCGLRAAGCGLRAAG